MYSVDYQKVIDRLSSCDRLLTVTDVAGIMDVHVRTIEHWGKVFDFPSPLRMDSSTTRYWRPDHVREWVVSQQDQSRNMLGIDQVCVKVGVHPETWHTWVKQDRAPAPAAKEIGSGRDLWRIVEVDEWLREKTGGYPLPNGRDYGTPVRKAVRRGPKRAAAGE